MLRYIPVISLFFLGFIADSHAFNLVQLADPQFKLWAFIVVPITLIVGNCLTNYFIYYPHLKSVISPKTFLKTFAKAQIKAILLNLLVIFIFAVVINVGFENQPLHDVLKLVFAIYIGVCLILVAWWSSKKAIANMLNTPIRDIPHKFQLLLALTIAYVVVYVHIYYKVV